MGWPMSRQPPSPALPGSSRHEHPNLGILLRIPFQEVVRRVSAGLAEAGFADLRPAHTAVFQHIDVDGSRVTDLAERARRSPSSQWATSSTTSSSTATSNDAPTRVTAAPH